MKRVLIADDHAIVREGLKGLLKKNGFNVIDEARSGGETLNHIQKNEYDLIILDINMPGRDGLDVLKQIRADNRSTPILILSMYAEEHYAVRSIRWGANGFLTKESITGELERAIKKISGGGKYVTNSLAEKLADEIGISYDGFPHDRLTEREMQIMKMILSGKKQTQIAEELNLSIKTISAHQSNILAKLGVDSVVELVKYAIKHGLSD